MSPRHSKHDNGRPRFRQTEPQLRVSEVATGAATDPTIGVPTEDQIKRLLDSTTIGKNKKATAPPPHEVRLGKDYEVLSLLGEGGMGYVYKVKDKRKNQIVAIKVVRPELAADPRAIKRFEQEAEAAMGLLHPNLVPVYGQGITGDGAPYLVMEYQEGTPLDKLLRQETEIGADRAVDIFMQICAALEHAHAKGIVHRDLKPSNIVLTEGKGHQDVVRIVDFGIAKILASPESRESVDLTNTGDLFGSPSYMSPEQCMGYSLDARSDVYSLGCVMYELLSGQPPFNCDNPVQTIVKHLSEAPERLGSKPTVKNIPASLDELVMRCLEKDPRNRYGSMTQLRQDLSNIQVGERPVFARPRQIAGRQMPLVAKIAVIASIDVMCLTFAFQQHEAVVKAGADVDAISVYSQTLDAHYIDAVENLRAFGTTHNPIFINRFQSAVDSLPPQVAHLYRYRNNDLQYKGAVLTVSERLEEGLSTLEEARNFLTNPPGVIEKKKGNDPLFETAMNLNASFNDWSSRDLRSYSRLRTAIEDLNKEANRALLNNSVQSSRNWLVGEVLALMAINMFLLFSLLRRRENDGKQKMWQKKTN